MTDRIPNIQIVPSSELIASCNVCGTVNYTRTTRGDVQPNGTKLWDLRYSPNGFQHYTTKFCLACLLEVELQIKAVRKHELVDGPVAILKGGV